MTKLPAISINPHMDQTLQTTVFSEGTLTGAHASISLTSGVEERLW